MSKLSLAGIPSSPPRDVPRNILLQWHITEQCNGQCSHCYQEGFTGDNDLNFAGLQSIIDQFQELLDRCAELNGGLGTRAHVTITGGEPFQRPDVLDLLDLLALHRKRFSLAILTNGTLIDDRLARYLGYLRPRFVQISIDGVRETHDKARGAGNFDKVLGGARHLIRHQVPTLVSFTAHRGNYLEFPEVAKIARTLGAKMVWSDRFVPLGGSDALRGLVLSAAETQTFFQLMSSVRRSFSWHPFNKTKVACHRALQFLCSGGRPYRCAAGSTLLTVLANGDLVPCRRLPLVVGNLRTDKLSELYWASNVLRNLRCGDPVKGCEACIHVAHCRGGLRCLAHAMEGDLFRADPGCWLAQPPALRYGG